MKARYDEKELEKMSDRRKEINELSPEEFRARWIRITRKLNRSCRREEDGV